jgi:hypothetical protein
MCCYHLRLDEDEVPDVSDPLHTEEASARYSSVETARKMVVVYTYRADSHYLTDIFDCILSKYS